MKKTEIDENISYQPTENIFVFKMMGEIICFVFFKKSDLKS